MDERRKRIDGCLVGSNEAVRKNEKSFIYLFIVNQEFKKVKPPLQIQQKTIETMLFVYYQDISTHMQVKYISMYVLI